MNPKRFLAMGLLAVTRLAGGQEHGHSVTPSGRPSEFAGLSLQELLRQEIAPINVLGSHTHLGGQFMVGYRYMRMEMEGNREGDRPVSDEEVLQRYPLVHTAMTMSMHMAELMYAPSDRLTLELMVPVFDNSMDHRDRDGEEFTAESSGLGDLSLMALFELGAIEGEHVRHRFLANGGLGLPTGSIDETSTHDGRTSRLEYVMQLGTGTVGFLPGFTYLGETDSVAWGAQAMGTLQAGRNDNDYRVGNTYRINAWGHYKLLNWLGVSTRLEWRQWYDIEGADPELDPSWNPAFDANLQAGMRLDVLGGLNVYVPSGALRGLRFSVEGGVPLYQSIDGPNVETDWLLNLAISHSFR